MANQTNTVTIQCGVTQDPTSKQVGEHTLAQFSIGNSRGFGNNVKQNYFNVEAWNKTAQTIMQYVKRGTQLIITGELKYEEWNDQSGNKRSAVKIVCREFTFISSGKKAEDKPAPAPVKQAEALPFNDDDIPF